jgi:hypothetical protein
MLECKGYKYWTDCGYEFDCEYPHATFSCEGCIINGGNLSPMTGKPFRGNIAKYNKCAKKVWETQKIDIGLLLNGV